MATLTRPTPRMRLVWRRAPRRQRVRARRARHLKRSLAFAALVSAVWLLSTEPWCLGVYQLLLFTAPGALLGLGAAWMAYLTVPDEWTWRRGRHAAVLGASTLPPFLAFMVALEGTARPQGLLVGFVYAAWVALLGGAIAALYHQHGSARRDE